MPLHCSGGTVRIAGKQRLHNFAVFAPCPQTLELLELYVRDQTRCASACRGFERAVDLEEADQVLLSELNYAQAYPAPFLAAGALRAG